MLFVAKVFSVYCASLAVAVFIFGRLWYHGPCWYSLLSMVHPAAWPEGSLITDGTLQGSVGGAGEWLDTERVGAA